MSKIDKVDELRHIVCMSLYLKIGGVVVPNASCNVEVEFNI